MQIVVNHLTRMQPGYICVAGIDLDTREHIRPVMKDGNPRLTKQHLVCEGGAFDIGEVVELHSVEKVATSPPMVEDRAFRSSKRLGTMSCDEFWRLLREVAKPSLADIYGRDLCARGNGKFTVEPGKGTCSLGCLSVSSKAVLRVDSFDGKQKVRLSFTDSMGDTDLAVTDLRLVQYQDYAPNQKLVEGIADRLCKGVRLILGVGLARPFPARGNTRKLHWLQVNNLHLEDDPLWRLPPVSR